MSDEKLMILTMLEEGKITTAEASKLIEALDEEDSNESKNSQEKSFLNEYENKIERLGKNISEKLGCLLFVICAQS